MEEQETNKINPSTRPLYLSIPTSLILNTNIPESAKILFGVFNLYKNKIGCWANNSFLATLTGVEERTISRNISILEEWLYIKVENKSNTTKRKILMNNYEEIYKEISDKIYNSRKNPDKLKGKEYREKFFEERNKYLENQEKQ